MAPFSRLGLPNWMTRSNVPSTQSNVNNPQQPSMNNTNNASIETKQKPDASSSSGQRKPVHSGITQGTGKSRDMPKSNEVEQHLAGYARDGKARHAGNDGKRMTSYDSSDGTSPSDDGGKSTGDTYAKIATDLDKMQSEVSKLREKEGQGPSTNVNHPQHHRADEESPAARLQKHHEALQAQQKKDAEKKAAAIKQGPPPPSPGDFPVLSSSPPGSPNATSSPIPIPTTTRKTSYADAASLDEAEESAFDGYMKHRAGVKAKAKASESTSGTRGSTTSAAVRRPPSSLPFSMDRVRDDRDDSDYAIVSPPNTNTGSSAGRAVPGQSTSRFFAAGKPQPRWAQPTQASARRTEDSVRKDTAPKSPAQTSPGKSLRSKEPTLATERRANQRESKRTSLPPAWASPQSQQSGSSGTQMISSPSTVDSPSSGDGWQVVGGRRARNDAPKASPKPQAAQRSSPSNGQTGSSMAATNATTRRVMATISQENVQQLDNRRGNNVDVRAGADHVPRPHFPSPNLNDAASDTSSVQFVLELPAVDTRPSVEHAQTHAQHSAQYAELRAQMMTPSMPNPSGHYQRLHGGHQRQWQPTSSRAPGSVLWSNGNSPARHSFDFAEQMLPPVQNTTMRRRVSNAQMLDPIMERLSAEGLTTPELRRNPVYVSYVSRRMSSPNAGSQAVAANLNSSPTANGVEPLNSVVPPHLRRSRVTSNGSTSTNTTVVAAMGIHPAYYGEANGLGLTMQSVAGNASTSTAGHPYRPDTTISHAPMPTLRATAREFRPIQPRAVETRDVSTTVGFMSYDTWDALDDQTRRNHTQLLHTVPYGGPREIPVQPTSVGMAAPAHYCPPLYNYAIPQGQRGDQDHPAQPYAVPGVGSVGEYGSPIAFKPRPRNPNPIMHSVRKTVQRLSQTWRDAQTSTKFGRAPILTPPAPELSPGATISSNSDNISPLQETPPNFPRGWHIRSASARNPYEWTGGDGREIAFNGYGPHAERDPNSVVNFTHQGQTTSVNGATNPRDPCGNNENVPAGSTSASSAQRRSAEKRGYSKVPCGKMDVSSAAEAMPSPSGTGNCDGCEGK